MFLKNDLFVPKTDEQKEDYFNRCSSFYKEIGDPCYSVPLMQQKVNEYKLLVFYKPLSNGEILILEVMNAKLCLTPEVPEKEKNLTWARINGRDIQVKGNWVKKKSTK